MSNEAISVRISAVHPDGSPSITLNDAPGADLEQVGRILIGRELSTSDMEVVKPLSGGYTDAQVLLVDISNSTSDDLDGQFVLKVEYSQGRRQSEAHQEFVQGLGGFAESHVPKLLRSIEDQGLRADLYDIAGHSMLSVRTVDHSDYQEQKEVCRRAAADLLTAQLTDKKPNYATTVGEVVQAWLGPDFPQNRKGRGVAEVVERLGVDMGSFTHEGEQLPNPLSLLTPGSPLHDENLPTFWGQGHGDLHLRNILVRGSRQTTGLEYWIIDVNWGHPRPLLYDQAYLEMAAFLNALPKVGHGRLIPILAKIDRRSVLVNVALDHVEGSVVDFVSAIRSSVNHRLEEVQPRRRDVWFKQYLLARVVAALNWAAKPMEDESLRRVAFLNAAWSARELLISENHYKSILVNLSKQATQNVHKRAETTPVTAADAVKLWRPFQSTDSGRDLFLITDGVESSPHLIGLAHSRWLGVLDLDPDSDVGGVASAVVPNLQKIRHVSVFGKNKQMASPLSATNWLMANGWSTRGEDVPRTVSGWRRNGYLADVRNLVNEVHCGTPNQSAAVLCLRSGKHNELIDRVVDYIDEKYQGIAVSLDLATSPAVPGFDLQIFLDAITTSLPSLTSGPVPTIPGLDGRIALDQADLRRLEVDLEVLHSEILAESLSAVDKFDDFWRGRPPTWDELEAQLDVPRTLYKVLKQDLTERLDGHQLATVKLLHSPGAGATTLARRVAWDMHRNNATVRLRNYSPTTAERIDEIYQRTGMSVLVIAEAADLPESDRDELMHSLRQRNSRAVILWNKRTNIQKHQGQHALTDPVDDEERKIFLREYRRRATSSDAEAQLEKLAQNEISLLPPQRLSPFYFGLCAFDDDFEALEPYVRNHLEPLDRKRREIARYLALLTRYGQLGIPVDLVYRWLEDAPPIEVGNELSELDKVLGLDLRHLVVVEQSGLRLLHPLIADHVLRGIENEKPGLAQISVEFIRMVVGYLGADNASTRRLLEELFVRRNVWSEREQKREHFSELIMQLNESGAEMVFAELTTQSPRQPHFWNHYGRYLIYRIRGEYRRAEEYLERAVEESNGRDSVHLHTLGMVRRFWIEDDLEKLSREVTKSSPEHALATIEALFDRAMEAFKQAREDPTSEYSWVTPIQLIAGVVESLVKISESENLAELVSQASVVAEWVASQLDTAEILLDDLRWSNGEGRANSGYNSILTARLDMLYGDVEGLIERWRELKEDGHDTGPFGLAVARTLFARAGRDWSTLSESAIREIVEMSWDRVREGHAAGADLRFWFQAYRRLPEYSETQAMERFQWYAANHNLLEAHYYLYIINFLLWARGDRKNQDRIRTHLEECKRLSRFNRRQWSYEWLGADGDRSRLVHFGELGSWDRERDNFWTRPELLQRVSGVIDKIDGPQAGLVRINTGWLAAFFVPGTKFVASRDTNQLVDFYLGFSYEGFRAWAVTPRGEKPDVLAAAERRKSGTKLPPPPKTRSRTTSLAHPVPVDQVPPPTPIPLVPNPPQRKTIDPALTTGIISKARRSPATYESVIIELITEAEKAGGTLSALKLGAVLQATFGQESYQAFRAEPKKLRGAVAELGFRIIPTKSGFDITLP